MPRRTSWARKHMRQSQANISRTPVQYTDFSDSRLSGHTSTRESKPGDPRRLRMRARRREEFLRLMTHVALPQMPLQSPRSLQTASSPPFHAHPRSHTPLRPLQAVRQRYWLFCLCFPGSPSLLLVAASRLPNFWTRISSIQSKGR